MDENNRMLAGRIGPCPTCRNGRLTPVTDGENTNFLCAACGSCWHVALGWVDRVNPDTCPGCPSQAACRAALVPYGSLATTFR